MIETGKYQSTKQAVKLRRKLSHHKDKSFYPINCLSLMAIRSQ